MNETYRFSSIPAGARTLALKQAYPGNLMWGITLASMVHLAVMATLLAFDVFDDRPIIGPGPVPTGGATERTVVVLPPPRSITTEPDISRGRPSITHEDLKGLIPDPVPDDEVIEEPEFPTRLDYAEANAGHWEDGRGGMEGSVDGTGGGFPGPSTLPVAWDAPVPLHLVQELPIPIGGDAPVYPEQAALLGKSATVSIRARLDATGKVVEAEIYHSTDRNSGFNEAALAAAFTRTYRPAIQNGRPVSVWIVYKVVFELSR